jgi:hypothetical protein
MNVVVFGLPGSGRTTLARELGLALSAVVLDEEKLFETLNCDLDRSPEGYGESARRIGWVASTILNNGFNCICVMRLSTELSRNNFRISAGNVYAIWMDTVDSAINENANGVWDPLKGDHCNLHVSNWCWEIDPIVNAISQTASKWGKLTSLDSEFTSGSRDNPNTVRDTDGPETVIERREEDDRRSSRHDRRSIASSVWGLLNTKL